MRLREFLELQVKANKQLNEGSQGRRTVDPRGNVYYTGDDAAGYKELHGLTEDEGLKGFDKNESSLFYSAEGEDIVRWGYRDGGPVGHKIPRWSGDTLSSILDIFENDMPFEYFIMEDSHMIDELNEWESTTPPAIINQLSLKDLINEFGKCLTECFCHKYYSEEWGYISFTKSIDNHIQYYIVVLPDVVGDSPETDVILYDRQSDTFKFGAVQELKDKFYDIIINSGFADKCKTIFHVAAILGDGSSDGNHRYLVKEFEDPYWDPDNPAN